MVEILFNFIYKWIILITYLVGSDLCHKIPFLFSRRHSFEIQDIWYEVLDIEEIFEEQGMEMWVANSIFFLMSTIYELKTMPLEDKDLTLESVQDFLIKLGIKPLMHLVEISTFSLNNVILRLTKIMNRADKIGDILSK